MKQQPGFENEQTQNGHRLIQRQTLVQPGQGNYYQQPQASKYRAGHYAGLQPEEVDPADLEEGERYYVTRAPTSARRYNVATDGYMIKQGNKTFRYRGALPQDQLPPQRQRRVYSEPEVEQPPASKRRRIHWLRIFGVGMLAMLALWTGLSMLVGWWQVHQDDATYGRPRTFQTDAAVGHNNDSATNPSHFIAINLNRHILIIELPAGDSTKAKLYNGPTLLGDGQDLTPVTLTFKDVNGDRLPDMVIHVQEQTLVLVNDQASFRPPKPGEPIHL
jgi:hypothetical protein